MSISVKLYTIGYTHQDDLYQTDDFDGSAIGMDD